MNPGLLSIDPNGQGIWIGLRHIRSARVASVDFPLPTGETLRTRGARVPLENGLELSILWGSNTYSTNKWAFVTETPHQVEIAVLKNGALLAWPDDDLVAGWVAVADLSRTIDRLASLPSSTERLPLEVLSGKAC